ncbi:hypothetical protein MRB53_024472 [Persea americana]|uniref:Uncharacterized protein n=1 Tax=Persea americana TaxID=3435 RepID=A0ACC2LCF0_PERAE|nr:hypothetical protein MRB53_024472 [Persea americana]
MGLCSDLNDVSSDSIPLLLIALFANCICYLKSLLFCLLQSVGLSRFGGAAGVVLGVGPFGSSVGSGLAGLVLLAEQLNVHRVFTFTGSDVGSDCVVCLSGLREGEQVRMLACRHVFHRECLDGWFDHQNLNCPLCRAPLVAEERVAEMGRRVGGDLVTWSGQMSEVGPDGDQTRVDVLHWLQLAGPKLLNVVPWRND